MGVSREEKKRRIRLTVTLVVIAAVIGVIYYILKHNGLIEFFSSREQIQAYIKGFGVWAPLAFFVLQVIQVIVTPIPGNVTTLAGGLLFGFWKALLISVAAILLGSVAVFLLARKYGRPLVVKLVKEETVDKYLKELSSRQRLGLILMFLFPFFPDDTISLIAGLTPIKTKEFIILSILTRPWGLVFSALIGASVIAVPLWGWVAIIAATVIIFAVAMAWGPKIEQKVKSWYKHIRDKAKTEGA